MRRLAPTPVPAPGQLPGLLLALLLIASVLTSGPTPRAYAATEDRPCDGLVLRAYHAASADYFDFNGDRLECWPREGASGTPRDDYALPTAPPGPDSRKFYSWGSEFGRPTSISFVDPATRTFGGQLEGQEDDPDFDGCQGVCPQVLTYDDNDYFYFDTGSGSTRVSLAHFETHVLGLTRFTMVYSRLPGESSVFSFEAAAPTEPQVRPSRPRDLHARAGHHRVRLHWRPPLRGLPLDAYQVRGAGRTYRVSPSRYPALTVRGLVNGRRYLFRVRAHNAVGWGAWSRPVAARPHR